MKPIRCVFSIATGIVGLMGMAFASEDVVTYTFQALTGLAGDTPRFEKVYCHDRYGMSGEPTSLSFICSPHLPPTSSKEEVGDHNLLSLANLKIGGELRKDGVIITLDASRLKVPRNLYDGSEESLIEFALECIRLTANFNKIEKYSLEIIASPELNETAQQLKKKFLAHDRSKRFTPHPADEADPDEEP